MGLTPTTICPKQFDLLCDKLQQIIDREDPPVVVTDVETICNSETNFWEWHTFTYVDGVVQGPAIVVASTITCDQAQPDYEQIRTCDAVTGTYHVVTSSIINNVETVISDVDTGQSCLNATLIPVVGEEVCATVDGGEPTQVVPYNVFDGTVFVGGGYLEAETMNQITGVVTLADPCDCCIDCKTCLSGATGETCGLLRVDANGASLSQGTLDGYSLVFKVADNPDCDVTVPLADSGTIEVIDTGGRSMVNNFATVLNDTLGSYGFRAVLCDSSAGPTDQNDTVLAVAGPTGAGDWSVLFDSNGTGDEYELFWDESLQLLFFNEFPNGIQLTNTDTTYNNGEHGGWLAHNCGVCAP